MRRTLADALTARAAPLPPNRSRLERRSVASFCRVRLFAACEVVLRRSAARRLAHAEVRRSHDTSVLTHGAVYEVIVLMQDKSHDDHV